MKQWYALYVLLCSYAVRSGIGQRTLHMPNVHMHEDVIKRKHFPRYWSIVLGIHRSPVNSPHKGKWRGALMFFLICAWINVWVNNDEAGDLRRHRAHYDVTLMELQSEGRVPVDSLMTTIVAFHQLTFSYGRKWSRLFKVVSSQSEQRCLQVTSETKSISFNYKKCQHGLSDPVTTKYCIDAKSKTSPHILWYISQF